MAAFKAAVTSGLSPVDFWQLTPYLTGLSIGAAGSKQATDAWMTATLSRAKKIPELDSLMGKAEEKKNNMDDLKNHLSVMRGSK